MIIQSVTCGYYGLRNECTNALSGRFHGGLGLVRGYLTSIGAGSRKNFVSNSNVSEFDCVLRNYMFRRLFSSGAPKKGSTIHFEDFDNVAVFGCIGYDVLVIV